MEAKSLRLNEPQRNKHNDCGDSLLDNLIDYIKVIRVRTKFLRLNEPQINGFNDHKNIFQQMMYNKKTTMYNISIIMYKNV